MARTIEDVKLMVEYTKACLQVALSSSASVLPREFQIEILGGLRAYDDVLDFLNNKEYYLEIATDIIGENDPPEWKEFVSRVSKDGASIA